MDSGLALLLYVKGIPHGRFASEIGVTRFRAVSSPAGLLAMLYFMLACMLRRWDVTSRSRLLLPCLPW
jgi:hypothetical protein